MASLFPLIAAPAQDSSGAAAALPLYREVAWDFEADLPIWRRGSPYWVTGREAVTTWIYNTIKTARREVDIFDPDWGNEIQALTGRPFSPEVKESEAARYLKEALVVNPYIPDVRQIQAELDGSSLRVACAVDTIYGEVDLDVAGL